MLGWCAATAATLLAFLLYVAFFYKINWIRDLRSHGKAEKNSANYFATKNRKVGKLPPVYPNGWFALLESSQVRKGQVKHVAALGENFAVFRTEKGMVNILDAYCPHLGANMAEGGRVRGECLECPFHSWLFRGEDGYCNGIPYSEKVPHIARTRTWKSCEVNQTIFVWYHSESAEPDWRPQPQAHISDGTWRYQGRNEFLVNCHIQDIAENGADLAHLSAVHGPAMFLTGNISWLARHSWTNALWTPQCSRSSRGDPSNDLQIKQNGTSSDPTPNGDSSQHREEDTKRDRHKASMQLRHNLILLERFTILELNVEVEQIGPGYVELMIQSSLGPMCILQTVTPMEPLIQRVTHVIFSSRLVAPYASIVFLGECLMFERDVAIWNHKRFERQPILVREDRKILAYRRWYSQFYSEHSPSYQSACESLQW